MRNLFALPRFVLTVGIAIHVLPAVSLAEDKNTSAANVSSTYLLRPPSLGQQHSKIPGTPIYGASPYIPYGPATTPYYQAPPTVVPYPPPASGYAPHPYGDDKSLQKLEEKVRFKPSRFQFDPVRTWVGGLT
jgi:hypothetical protein